MSGGAMVKDKQELNLFEILSHRGELMDADHRLAEALQSLLAGSGDPGICLAAIEAHQRAYQRYVNKVLVSLGGMELGAD